MVGFLIGTACLVGLFSMLRRGGWEGRCGGRGWGGDWQGRFGGPWDGEGGPPWSRGGGGGFQGRRRRMLGFLFERLDTTAGQEKVITAALDDLRSTAEAHRGELRRTRADVAAATRSPSFDETRLGELFARHDDALTTMRKELVGALAKIHAVLDDRQRERLADLLESGSFFGGMRHGRGRHGRAWA
ncbi:Spy/CpxP family protein refolding chaperone [Chondromyces crocatus]|uniref:Periplasmic heavy metal sensor n=1 Tax=Chondromyces crocatus TaxID=52 RepID=A0A0K1EEY4_CHOCO|nr:periplasmic heavy metal sensor [Chondromyces crocatus]AKT39414.1 uncharacterized protein CMC5_035610 [Chondromyces crocatus]